MGQARRIAIGGIAALILLIVVVYVVARPSDPEGPSASGTSQGRSDGTAADSPGVTGPGILIEITPNPDATLQVRETVLLAEATDTIELDPPDLSRAGDAFAAQQPFGSMLEVSVDGRPVSDAPRLVDRARTVPLDRPASSFELRYRLDQATATSLGPSPGRALAAFTPLTVGVPDDLPVAITTLGSGIRNLACPTAERPELSCAAGTPPALRVNQELPVSEALVIIQFDLSEDPG